MHILVGAPLLSALTGCLSASSSDLSTSDIAAEMFVEADGEMTHVRTVLRNGRPDSHTYVQVDGDDRLSLDDGDRPLLLKENSLGSYVYYTQDVTTQEPGTVFTILFERAADGGAPASTVTLPESFEVPEVEEGASVSRSADPLIVTWDPPSPSWPMQIDLSGACIEKKSARVTEDAGNHIFQPGELVSQDGAEAESCKLTVTLTRSRDGVPDGGWADGSTIASTQIRSYSLTLEP